MIRPYFSLFANFFLTLVISRPNFRGLAQYTLDALKHGRAVGQLNVLAPAFDELIAAFTLAIAKFDVTLTERNDPTAGDTEAFRVARTAWLAWVQEQQIKVVNPALFGQEALKDFRRFTRGKLGALNQETLMTQSEALVALYDGNSDALQPLYALYNPPPAGGVQEQIANRAKTIVTALRTADSTRDTGDMMIDTSITTLNADWVTLAGCLRRAKGLLEYTFATDEEVYDYFDFSKAKPTKKQNQADAATPPPAPQG